MRLCTLRGVFVARNATETWVWHDPSVWLGAAFYRVMHVAVCPGTSADDSEMAWESAVANAVDAAAEHPLDCRFRSAVRWPGYFLVWQRALALGAEVRARVMARNSTRPRVTDGATGIELRVEMQDWVLAGRPDFLCGRTIVSVPNDLSRLLGNDRAAGLGRSSSGGRRGGGPARSRSRRRPLHYGGVNSSLLLSDRSGSNDCPALCCTWRSHGLGARDRASCQR